MDHAPRPPEKPPPPPPRSPRSLARSTRMVRPSNLQKSVSLSRANSFWGGAKNGEVSLLNVIHGLDGGLCGSLVVEADETESAATSGVAVLHHSLSHVSECYK